MNLIKIIFFLSLFVNGYSLKNINKLVMVSDNKILNKTKSYLQLTRANNILPTTLLSFTGAYITSTNNLIPKTIVTVLTMCYSMIVNDIFDYEIDKINNPTRPLVSGKVTLYEALTLMVIILKTIDYVSYYYLPKNLQRILEIMVIIVSLYTPILKKIPLIKNLTCASVISFAIFFSGLGKNNKFLLYIAFIPINNPLLYVYNNKGKFLIDSRNKLSGLNWVYSKFNGLNCQLLFGFGFHS
jgi:geranylgeranylglycerol-phosphate geranylgeranyltransferase